METQEYHYDLKIHIYLELIYVFFFKYLTKYLTLIQNIYSTLVPRTYKPQTR